MQKYFLSLLVSLLIPLLVYGQAKMDQNSMGSMYESNYKAVMSAMEKGQVDKLDAYIASDIVDHDIDPSMTKKTGLAAVKEMFTHYHKIFPDMKTTIHSMATSGDLFFAYVTFTGTTSEPYMGMPAGEKVSMDQVDLVRFKGDKAVEHWGFTANADIMKMMPQDEMMEENENMEQGM
jgi:predicted ester cyclase